MIVVGLQTEYCIDAAVKCGFEHGFEIIVPKESNSTSVSYTHLDVYKRQMVLCRKP